MTDIISQIKYHISNLPHIGSPLPKTWTNVREALEKDLRNHITRDEYLQICQKNGFTNLEDKLQLSGYLHDLGVCLHFQDDPLLNKTVILKPKWGTDAVYKVLDNSAVINNHGQFNHTDLATIWQEEEYATMHAELLRLMINFNLCYKIPDTSDYIAPQLLSENQPDYKWSEDSNLTLRYTYEFMPKGIITQFIVATHNLIAGQKYVWKSGVILRKDETVAEVIEHYGKREIRIRIVGKYRKEFMTIVMYELDRIHSSYRRLKVNKLIPCNCKICTNLREPHYYLFEKLREFVSNGQTEIQCQIKPYEMTSVLGLIDDVIGKEKFIEQEKEKGSGIIQVIIQQSGFGDNVTEETMKQEKVINIGNNAQISAPVTIADTIKNSFNALGESDVNSDIRTLLDQLLRAINEVGKTVSTEHAETAQTMARDAETLIKEAVSSNPRRQWYEISIAGLKQAAINIGEVAKPVLEIVGKLTPLLFIEPEFGLKK